MTRSVHALLAAAACLMLWAGSASAQSYPDRPIALVLGFATGGPADTAARLVADGLSKGLGQPVVVENKPGAVGTIAAGSVARAAPDGYTLLVAAQSNLAIAPNTLASVPFDPLTSFAPITTTIVSPWVLMAAPDLPVGNLAEFIEHAKKQPGQLNYGSIGRGSSHNFVSELFKRIAGIDVTHVPYKGSAEAHLALRKGEIHMLFDTMPGPIGLLSDGKVKGLAVTGSARSAVLPAVPTFAEQGMPQMDVYSWFGLAAPAKTPAPVVARLHEKTVQALAEPSVQDTLRRLGLRADTRSPAEFAAFLASENVRWRKVVEETGFRKE